MNRLLILVVGCLPVVSSFPAQGQTRSGLDLFEESRERTPPATTIQAPGIALESTIQPEKYHVGPSDIIAVNIWLSPPLSFNLTVTPEGTLIVPTVGEILVSDMTLAEAKGKVLAEIRKKYITAPATVTLVRPRPIVVTVTGHVLNPGLYTLSATDRADRALAEANAPSRLQTSGDVWRILNEMSTRNIVLKHKDGSTSRVDIDKFLATKDDAWNPYLREGDIVIVPVKNIRKNVIGVYGEVNVPGRYEYVRGDSIKDALKIAHGFTRLAIRDSIEFSRLSLDGASLSKQIIDGERLLQGLVPDLALEPGDRIVVRSRVDLREDYRVTITGEVLYPGTYPITKGQTRLSEVIAAAGGFTQFADLKSAEVHRRSISPGDATIEMLLSARGGVPEDDSLYYFTETNLRLQKEIVSVDFEKLFIEKDAAEDIVLQSEDYINVPSLKKTVYVFGQVVSPGHVPFSRRQDVSYYIEKAGGYTDRARTGDVKIIKAKTKQWLDPGDTVIEDGDYIWIPKKIDRPLIYYTTIVSHLATILSAVVGIAIVVATVGK